MNIKLNRALSILLLMAFIFSCYSPAKAQGAVTVTASPASPSILPGKSATVTVTIKNDTGSNDTFYVGNFGSSNSVCTLDSSGGFKTAEVADGATATFSITITIVSDATPGTNCSIPVTVQPTNNIGSSSTTINVTVATPPTPTETPRPTSTPVTNRPVLEVAAYAPVVTAVGDFTLNVQLKNTGPVPAYNIMATFTGGGIIVPLNTGGLIVSKEIPGYSGAQSFPQPMRLTKPVIVDTIVRIFLELRYDGPNGLGEIQTLEIPITVEAPDQPTLPPVGPTPASDLNRPVLQIRSYFNAPSPVKAGGEFDMVVNLINNGAHSARNIFVKFEAAGILPRDTGGILLIKEIKPTETAEFKQPMIQVGEISADSTVPITATVTYVDDNGTSYNDTFTLALPIAAKKLNTGGGAWATPTPTGVKRAQFLVSGLQTSVDPLQPGTVFDLTLEIHNLGNSDARGVTMVLGGATETTDNSSGTPVPSGISVSSSDTSKFAPLGSSNLVYLGDVPFGGVLKPTLRLVVNVNTDPGAYPLKLSFVYNDAKNNRKMDDQIVTLLVYSLPKLEIGFYQEVRSAMKDMPSPLPIQVTNIGKKNAVLGNITVVTKAGKIENGKSLVGSLDPGGYFTHDATLIPDKAGETEIEVTVNYNDDFNQPRSFSKTLKLTVEDAPPTPDPSTMPSEDGMNPDGMGKSETLWQKVLRFFKGLLGLGSDDPNAVPPEIMPTEAPKAVPLG